MASIIFITGGARSGKSRFAQKLTEIRTDHPLYLATAHVWDEDFAKRVRRHQQDRGPQWETLEKERNLDQCNLSGRTVLLDCITLWLTNLFVDNGFDEELTRRTAFAEWDGLVANSSNLIVVSNELGMGVHPAEESARKFADLQGWMNQKIASEADEVFLMVSGIPLKIK